MDKNPSRYQVSCEIDGKSHHGTYWVAGKILTVSTGMGGKSTQVGAMPAETLAKQLLAELAKEGKAELSSLVSACGARSSRIGNPLPALARHLTRTSRVNCITLH